MCEVTGSSRSYVITDIRPTGIDSTILYLHGLCLFIVVWYWPQTHPFPSSLHMYTQVSMAFIVTISYDPRNKFHYCMSKFYKFEFRFWTFNKTVYKQPAVLSLCYPYNECNANIHIWNKVLCSNFVRLYIQLAINTHNSMQMLTFAILNFFNGGYHKNQVICPDIFVWFAI